MRKSVTHLWFDSPAEEAARFYASIFKNSKLRNISRYSEAVAAISGRAKGSVMTVDCQLERQTFLALNGGPIFKFSEAISLVVNSDDQTELDNMWNKLCEGGQAGQ